MAIYALFRLINPDSELSFGPTLAVELNGDRVVDSVEISSSSLGSGDLDLFLVRTATSPERDSFVGVCSPLDLLTYSNTRPGTVNQLYRANSVTLTTRAMDVATALRTRIVEHLRSLTATLRTLDDMADEEVVTHAQGAQDSSSSAGRTATLTRAALVPYPDNAPVGYLLSVSCETVGYDSDIFYHRIEVPLYTGETQYRPIGVCTPADMDAYPVGAANVTEFPPFFRSNEFAVVSRNIAELCSGWNNLKRDFRELMRTLDLVDQNNDNDSVSEVSV